MATITQKVIKNLRARKIPIFTRQQWGTRHATTYAWRRVNKRHKLLPKRRVDTCWQHITVTRDTGSTNRSFFSDMQTVERIGWERFKSGVSYNWVVDMDSGVIGVGQPLDAKGTHTINNKDIPGYSYDQNAVSVAIAVLGMPGKTLTKTAENSLANLIAAMIEENVLTKGHDYVPHSLVAYKECPTGQVARRMDEINKKALSLVKG